MGEPLRKEAVLEIKPKPADRTRERIELLIFLFLILPPLLLAHVTAAVGSGKFTALLSFTVLHDIALVCLVLYFLWANKETFAHIGWRWGRSPGEPLLGALLYLPVTFVVGTFESLVQRAHVLPAPKVPGAAFAVQGETQYVLAIVLIAGVAICEETIFRGYLLRRLEAFTRSKPLAVVISSFIFALGHGYEGFTGMILVGLLGAAFAIVYLWRGSLIAPIVMHFLQDAIALTVISRAGLSIGHFM